MLIPSSVLLSSCHPVTLSLTLLRFCNPLFPRVRSLSWFVFLSNFSPLNFPPFPYGPFHYFLYSTYEWDHMIIVFLWLTYFTQQKVFQCPSPFSCFSSSGQLDYGQGLWLLWSCVNTCRAWCVHGVWCWHSSHAWSWDCLPQDSEQGEISSGKCKREKQNNVYI